MCDICDGQSPLAAYADFHQKMLRYGWVLQMVEGPSPWSCTIGLETHVGHPDLVIIDLERHLADHPAGRWLAAVTNQGVRPLGIRGSSPG
jgi:hypothetical protein